MFSFSKERLVVILFVSLLSAACQPEQSEPPLPATERGQVEVDAVVLRYATVGEGETCLWLGSAPVYSQLFPEALSPILRCTALDSRFWVASASPEDPFDISAAVSEVEAARQALGLERFVVAGHSIQGLIAQEYARVHPDRVKGVIVIGYGPHPPASEFTSAFWEEDASEERKNAAATWSARFSADSLPPPVSDWEAFSASYLGRTPRVWFDPDTDTSWLDGIEGGEVNLAILRSFQSSVPDFNVLEEEPAPTRPVFVALGRFDYLIPFTIWDPWKAQAENLTLQLFPESGHWPHLEQPQVFAARLREWLGTLN